MGLFDKLKNIFIEEEEIDDDLPVIEKKEIKIEEVKKETKIVPKIEEVKEEVISERTLSDTNQKFKFPVIFEEDDFKEEKKKSKSINVLERENTKYEPEIKKEVNAPKKAFKPSPVISPVYGVLNKNYSKDEITSKDGLLNDSETVDIDYVIKKAYGESVTVSTREEKSKIVEEKKEKEVEEDTVIDLFENIEVPTLESLEKEMSTEEVTVEEIDDKIKSIDELLKDTSDDDFYSLVDSMYKDEEGDEE